MADSKDKQKSLRGHAYGMVGVLVLLYLFGMFVDLFVKFPQTTNKAQLWAFSFQNSIILGHILLGLILFLGTVALLIRSIVLKSRNWIISSAVALVAILVAVGAGSSFITTQADSLSYVMSVSFLVALLSYGWGIFTSR